jgi:hypothetical protein
LQQLRWSPENIADTPQAALASRFMLPGARYSAPEFAWKFEVAPGGIGFVAGGGLGPEFQGDLFVAAARPFLEGGHLFRLQLTGNRRAIATDDPRLRDRVADNRHKWEITESESLLIGRNFGVGTDVQPGPNGNQYRSATARSTRSPGAVELGVDRTHLARLSTSQGALPIYSADPWLVPSIFWRE